MFGIKLFLPPSNFFSAGNEREVDILPEMLKEMMLETGGNREKQTGERYEHDAQAEQNVEAVDSKQIVRIKRKLAVRRNALVKNKEKGLCQKSPTKEVTKYEAPGIIVTIKPIKSVSSL